MREIRTLRATRRGLETWNGRDTSADRRASPRPYLGAPGGETPLGDSTTSAVLPYHPNLARHTADQPVRGGGTDRLDHARIGQRRRVALALQLELARVDAARAAASPIVNDGLRDAVTQLGARAIDRSARLRGAGGARTPKGG